MKQTPRVIEVKPMEQPKQPAKQKTPQFNENNNEDLQLIIERTNSYATINLSQQREKELPTQNVKIISIEDINN